MSISTTLATRSRNALAAALLTAGLVGGGLAAAGTAEAATLSCNKGYNNANTAWGTCTGSGEWRIVTWCYASGSTSTPWQRQNGGTQSRYSSCWSPSHVTNIFIETRG